MTFYRIWPKWIASFIAIVNVVCVIFHISCSMHAFSSIENKTKQNSNSNKTEWNKMECANFLLILLFFTYVRHRKLHDSAKGKPFGTETGEYFIKMIKSNWPELRVRVLVGFLYWFSFHLIFFRFYFRIRTIKTTLSLATSLMISEGCHFHSYSVIVFAKYQMLIHYSIISEALIVVMKPETRINYRNDISSY